MPAPQVIKDELCRLLDEAYDADGVSISRVEVVSDSFVFYGDGEQPDPTPQVKYKITVSAADPENIVLRIRPIGPLLWPF